MCYDDVTVIYFYTGGTKGGDEDLRNLLRYIESSKSTNAVDAVTEQANDYVSQVKYDTRKRGTYMTVGDWIDGIVREEKAEQAARLAEKDASLAEQAARLAEKDASLAQQADEIARLKAEIEKLKNY